MIRKNQKLAYLIISFIFFLVIGFFYLSANKVFAAALEVKYPAIGNQNITSNIEIPAYIKYLFDAGMFIGFFAVFISLVWAGVLYLLSPIKPDYLSPAKDRTTGAITGLLILSLTYLIITTINPQLSFLNFNKPSSAPKPPAEKKDPGVYFYNVNDCSDASVTPITTNTPDLGTLKNRVNSVGIVQNPDNKTSYISILYDNTNLWGKCQYITTTDSNNPNQSCQPVSPFAASASVYKYNGEPNDDGVYFYRKSYFNSEGGFYKVDNSDIKSSGIYVEKLENLKFTGSNGDRCNVPETEQNCTKYDEKQNCTQRSCPTLAGENISSVGINGNYLVMFVYFNPQTDSATSWTYCQEFPTINDVSKLGPQQMKWQNVRNIGGVVPNYVIIIPILPQ
jgi:hypothetical protein